MLEKIDVIAGFLSLLSAATYAAVTGPFRGDWGACTYRQHINHAIVRKMFSRFNTLQLQYISGTFGDAYLQWCKENGTKPEYVTLESGCRAFWIGDHREAKYIVVYCHGGGFSLDGDDAYLKFWHAAKAELNASDITIAMLFLEYSLVPHATFPTQISEAIEAMNYVMAKLKRHASEIILAGDSAGGNLCLGVMLHAMHPSPSLPAIKIADRQKLKALILVSPWVSFGVDWPSEERNRYKDIVTAHAGTMWSGDYLAGKETSPYAEPLHAPTDWWKDCKVERMLTVAGTDEVLADPISQWVQKYQSVNANTVTFLLAQHEIHAAPIVNLRFGDSKETQQGQTIKSWMKANL